jgi:F0F1-type ATP synthase membrane subunit c/vacuolar-type H+-ATPase subunit K
MTESTIYIAKAMAILGMLTTALGQGYLIGKGFEAMGRNPQLENSLFGKMIVMVAMTETTAIFAFVAFFLIG